MSTYNALGTFVHDIFLEQINEETSRAPANGPLWGLGSGNSIGCPPILHFGTEAQRETFLPAVHRGDLRFCLAITEPGGASQKQSSRG